MKRTFISRSLIENRRPVTETTAEQMRQTYETNVFGVVTVTAAMLPLLRRSHNEHAF